MTEYKIRELCGDWALDIPMGNDIVVLYFNSRANAEMVKNVLEWENAHPNEAIPYNTSAIDPESLRPTAHWVKDGDAENPYRGSGTKYHCSACGRRAGYKQRWLYKFCPRCGRPMTDEAVDIVMKRLEALYE